MSLRQDTKLESEGAEFLVLGNLLIAGVSCFKAYVNFPGYDLVAWSPTTSKTAKIQVKSRWATNYDKSFPIKNFDCDFVVHVALNRGYRFGKMAKADELDVKAPEFYIFPIDIVQKHASGRWGKVVITKISDYQDYRDKWSLISNFLSGESFRLNKN